jgi:transglutaminase-like putative cysteine protease
VIHTPPKQRPVPGPAYLESTRYFDCDNRAIRARAERFTQGETTDIGKAIKLFYGVRDGWRYDPFAMQLVPENFIASCTLGAKAAFCIPKAILLVALARASGIPAAIGMADVVNHLNTDKLRDRLGGKDLFIYHGYAVLFLEGQWVKAAPAFNIELCKRFGVLPTEFDGRGDAIFQEYDAFDRRHMEYVNDRGCWSEFPFEQLVRDFRAFYPASAFDDAEPAERFEDGVAL